MGIGFLSDFLGCTMFLAGKETHGSTTVLDSEPDNFLLCFCDGFLIWAWLI
jgi:hypothetical protein